MALSPAAIGIVFNETKTHVLLVKRKDLPIWVLPGGGIDVGEPAEAAVIREVLEETGYQVRVKRQSAEYTPINRLASLTSVFICEIEKGEPRLSCETAAIDFFSLDNLPSNFFYLHRDWLNDALTYPGLVKKPLNQVTYLFLFIYFLKHPIQVLRYLWTRLAR